MAHRLRGSKGSGSMAARDQLLAEAAHEAEGYGCLGSRGRLLQSLDAHTKGHLQTLAVPASTACQLRQAVALGPDLLVAGLRDANVTGSGAWSCTLELPALFEPGAIAHTGRRWRRAPDKEVVEDLL